MPFLFVLFGAPFLVPMAKAYPFLALALFIASLVLLVRFYRFVEQRFGLLIDRHPVSLTLYMDARCRSWVEWESGGHRNRSRLFEACGTGWVNYVLELDGKCYPLRIYLRSYRRGGYMVSNWGGISRWWWSAIPMFSDPVCCPVTVARPARCPFPY